MRIREFQKQLPRYFPHHAVMQDFCRGLAGALLQYRVLSEQLARRDQIEQDFACRRGVAGQLYQPGLKKKDANGWLSHSEKCRGTAPKRPPGGTCQGQEMVTDPLSEC